MSFSQRLLELTAPPLAATLVRMLGASMKLDIVGLNNVSQFWDERQRVIFSTWHEQVLLMPLGYRGAGATVLISASGDGELLARMFKQFGIGAVRGSSSRGGATALRNMVRLGQSKDDLAITPDGPKGPRREPKTGVAHLAKVTRRPVVPFCFVCSRGHRFKSWDRFLLPGPFGRGVFAYGQPVFYQQGESPETFCTRLNEAMGLNEASAVARLEECGVSAV